MATSPHRGYRLPSLTDAPDGPSQLLALGDDVDVDVQQLSDKIDLLLNPPRAMLVYSGTTDASNANDSRPWGFWATSGGYQLNGMQMPTAGSPPLGTGIRVPVDGDYLVGWSQAWSNQSSAGRRGGIITANGNEVGYLPRALTPANAANQYTMGGRPVRCNANDVLGLVMYQDSGSALQLNAATFWAFLIGRN